jgi:hypothetical protein
MNTPALITFGELFDKSYVFLKQEWRATLKWTLGLFLVQGLIGGVTGLLEAVYPVLRERVYDNFLVAVIGGLASLWIVIQLMRHVAQKTGHTLPSQSNGQTMWKLLLSGIIAGLLVLGASIFLIVPGVWLAIMFSMATWNIIVLSHAPWQSLTSSYALVKGRWWATLARTVAPSLVFFAIQLAFGLAVAAIIIVLGLSGFALLQNFSGMNLGSIDWSALIASISLGGKIAAGLVGVFVFLILLAVSIVFSVARTLFVMVASVHLYDSLVATKPTPVSEKPASA